MTQVSTGGNPFRSGLWTLRNALLLLFPQDMKAARHQRLHTDVNLFCSPCKKKKRQFNKNQAYARLEFSSNHLGRPHRSHASCLLLKPQSLCKARQRRSFFSQLALRSKTVTRQTSNWFYRTKTPKASNQQDGRQFESFPLKRNSLTFWEISLGTLIQRGRWDWYHPHVCTVNIKPQPVSLD